MDDISTLTDKLRKTYRQSIDVMFPLAEQEAIVYCSDSEFNHILEEKHSVQDLQVCIHLLERHIDLQQEMILGLTNMQELHKDDGKSLHYNEITDKLLEAQNKLAMLRSRTVRCLTKQVQLRSADSKIQLPQWSSEIDYERRFSSTESESKHHKQVSQKEKLPNVDNTTKVLLSENVREASDTIYGKYSNEVGQAIGESDARSFHRDGQRTVSNNNDVEMKQEFSRDNVDVRETSRTYKTDATGNGSLLRLQESKDSGLQRGEETELLPEQNSNGLQLILNVSNFPTKMGTKRNVTRVNSRHFVKPVEEQVTVHVGEETDGGKPEDKAEVSMDHVEHSKPIASNDITNDAVAPENDFCVSNSIDRPYQKSFKTRVNTLNWDPSLLIKRIFGKVKPITIEEVESGNDGEVHMAGYLEKLPVNSKKSSLLKSWRKRYFKILNGKLHYFEDHRSDAPISFINLGGCEVADIGGKCLQVMESDVGGKTLVIRCGTWPEHQDWRKALESESKAKVKREHFQLVKEKKKVIIVDLGSSSIKAGFLDEQTWPQVIIPSVCAINKEDSATRFYGFEALSPAVRNSCKLVYPLRSPLTVEKSLLDPVDLLGFLEIVFRDLQVDISQYQVVMSTPVNLRGQDKERLVAICFDYFQVAAVYMKSQAILSMYSYSSTFGIVVNIGDHIDVVPIEEGYVIESGMSSLPYGGHLVTDHFMRLLSASGYRYFSEVENYIAEYLKVSTCYVSQDYDQEMKDFSDSDSLTVDMSEFHLPNGDRMVTVCKQRFMAYEGLFRPQLFGKDTSSITDMVYSAVMACSIDSRKELCRNIFLSGATTKAPGFAERLQRELSQKFPSSRVVQVNASADRQYASFIGAAVVASLESFDDLCITAQEWEETGPEVLKKWDRT